MNIGQIARQQQMMYSIANRAANSNYQTQIQSQLSSAASNFGLSNQSAEDRAANLMQSMGISGLEGRTIREMAQYKLQQVKENAAAIQQNTASKYTPDAIDYSSLVQQFSVRQQYTPISDEATEAMQKLALEDAKNSVGSTSQNSTERVDLIREHLQDVTPSKRTAAFNTMNKVWQSEIDRIGDYIKDNDPSWTTWGDKFDTSILDGYKAGVNFWF